MTILFSLILFIGVSFQAEAQTAVKYDQVISYSYTDTLTKDDVYTSTIYYIKDFAENLRFQVQGDSISDGYTKLSSVVYGSLDNSNWTAMGSAVVLSATGADSDGAVYTNQFYDYVKIVITAIDSVQNSDFDWNLLIDKND